MESTGRGTGSTLPFIPIRRVTCTHARAIFIHASAYCDWVVDSLNRDLPYDKFLIMQLAADQASPSDRSALAAMGYLTLGRRFLGVTHDITDDRIDVVCRGMLGLTVGNPNNPDPEVSGATACNQSKKCSTCGWSTRASISGIISKGIVALTLAPILSITAANHSAPPHSGS